MGYSYNEFDIYMLENRRGEERRVDEGAGERKRGFMGKLIFYILKNYIELYKR